MNRIKNAFALVGILATVIIALMLCISIINYLRYDRTKEIPLSLMFSFETNELQKFNPFKKYELVDSFDFNIIQGGTEVYTGTNMGKGVVFSFNDVSRPIDFFAEVKNGNEDIENYEARLGLENNGEMSITAAFVLELPTQASCKVNYGDIVNDGTALDNPASGKLNVYKIK